MKRIISFLFLIFPSCSEESIKDDQLNYVRLNTRVWDKGFKIGEGDFVSFHDDSSVFARRNDTVYFRRIPRAIKKVNRKYNETIVSSIATRESGIYINNEEFTR